MSQYHHSSPDATVPSRTGQGMGPALDPKKQCLPPGTTGQLWGELGTSRPPRLFPSSFPKPTQAMQYTQS